MFNLFIKQFPTVISWYKSAPKIATMMAIDLCCHLACPNGVSRRAFVCVCYRNGPSVWLGYRAGTRAAVVLVRHVGTAPSIRRLLKMRTPTELDEIYRHAPASV